jgi:hypothetical protein
MDRPLQRAWRAEHRRDAKVVAARRRREDSLVRSVVVPVSFALIASALVVLVVPQLWPWYPEVADADPTQRLMAVDLLRQRLVQVLAVGTIAGALLQYRAGVLERVSSDYRTGLELLSSDDAWRRVAGVYAIGGIAARHPEYRERTADVLATLIRERAVRRQQTVSYRCGTPDKNGPGGKLRPDPDVQAALFVLASPSGPGTHREGQHAISLSDVELDGVNLRDGQLSDVAFRRSVLRDASCEAAVLADCEFRDAVLRGADLTGAVLKRSQFVGADLTKADLRRAVLTDARFKATIVDGAHLAYAEGWSSDDTVGQPHCLPAQSCARDSTTMNPRGVRGLPPARRARRSGPT